MVRQAERIGMRVNSSKTAVVCVPDSLAYEADAYILDEDGLRIGYQEKIKVLGMRFSNKPTMGAHVAWLKSAVRKRF